MKKVFTILLLVVLGANSFAQFEIRSLEDFSKLDVGNALEVILIQDNKNELYLLSYKSCTGYLKIYRIASH